MILSDILNDKSRAAQPWEMLNITGESFSDREGASFSTPGSEVRSEDVQVEQMPSMPTAEEIETWEREGRDAGHKEGYKEGYEKGLAEAVKATRDEFDQRKQAFENLLHSLSQPLDDIDEAAEQQILQLIVVLAQQLVRRELRLEPGEVIAVIRESIALLPASAQNIQVRLNPEDAALVRELLSGGEGQWQLIDDPLISRGGCCIESNTSRIEATLESRLAALSASLLGGERETDQASGVDV